MLATADAEFPRDPDIAAAVSPEDDGKSALWTDDFANLPSVVRW